MGKKWSRDPAQNSQTQVEFAHQFPTGAYQSSNRPSSAQKRPNKLSNIHGAKSKVTRPVIAKRKWVRTQILTDKDKDVESRINDAVRANDNGSQPPNLATSAVSSTTHSTAPSSHVKPSPTKPSIEQKSSPAKSPTDFNGRPAAAHVAATSGAAGMSHERSVQEERVARLQVLREAEELAKKILDTERLLNESKARHEKFVQERDYKRKLAAEEMTQLEKNHRQSLMTKGLRAALKVSDPDAQPQQRLVMAAADPHEITRVMSAKSDHDVMRLLPGCSREMVKKRFRSMTLALHPDKCKEEGANSAFHRVVVAYTNLKKYTQ